MYEKLKLSVVIPVYNTGKYLSRCLDSIVSQSYKNLEIIIVNDCSPDYSEKIIQEYCSKDSRIHSVKHEKNRGLFQARLTGAGYATGDYIAFVDSDDYLSLDFYRELMQCAEQESCDIVAGDTVRDLGNNTLVQSTLHKICFDSVKLSGDEVRNHFYGQEGCCYAWHTMWNKVYSKALWDQCTPEYEKITQHLIMTEDIAFSSILFYNSQSFMHIEGNSSCYFYCANEEASTNTQNITFNKFRKNMQDLILVFNFVENFLISRNASDEIRDHFKNFRKRYHQMWKRLQEDSFSTGPNSIEAKALSDALGAGTNTGKQVNYPSFEQLESAWYPQIEQIRMLICQNDVEVVSFDIFDTLLLRPFWYPEDLFVLMQKQFEELCPDFRNLSFKTIRQAAENKARSEIYRKIQNAQDITLDEIYDEMSLLFHIPAHQTRLLQKCEENMELKYSRCRKTTKSLFDFAKACAKRIILVSDMYLNAETIEAMLHKNGYTDYEHLYLSSQERVTKYSGKLFERVLSDLNLTPKKILHIGDNWQCDICMAKSKGFQTAFLPKSRDRFCNTVSIAPTNYLSSIGCLVGGNLTTWNKLYASIGFRSMAALAANQLFDNPYASWNPRTSLDANPYVMGYYAVGMHLVGISKWLTDIAKQRRISTICFLARDGYLPMMAMDMLKSYLGAEHISLRYVPCSRMCLMPWIIENEQGFYELPIEFRAHTPLSIAALLDNLILHQSKEMLLSKIREAGFDPNIRFTEQKTYYQYITWLKDHLICADLLEKEKNLIRVYYQQQIPEGSLVFDLGYSGRILSAASKALAYPVTFAYVHEDNSNFQTFRRRNMLDVEVMYNHIPPYSDLIREYFLSEVGNSCIRIQEKNGQPFPIFTETNLPYTEYYTSQKIREGAAQFIRDFVGTFMPVKDLLYFDPVQVSMPFEGLLHSTLPSDRNALVLSRSDDTVYGSNSCISMAQFWMNQQNTNTVCGNGFDSMSSLNTVLSGKNYLAKFIVYAICDREALRVIVYEKLKSRPVVQNAVRSVYRLLKKIYHKLKG